MFLDQFKVTSQEKLSVLIGVPVKATSNPLLLNSPTFVKIEVAPEVGGIVN
ncbi:hypothetical protein D3C72_2534200 [compost metagenome]